MLVLSFSNKIDFFTLMAINMSHHPFLLSQTFEKKRTKMHKNKIGIFFIVILIFLLLIHTTTLDKIVETRFMALPKS